MPNGHGATRQHTPQPLQAWPGRGLGGAKGWMWITWASFFVLKNTAGMDKS
jgi:hypothetical protein